MNALTDGRVIIIFVLSAGILMGCSNGDSASNSAVESVHPGRNSKPGSSPVELAKDATVSEKNATTDPIDLVRESIIDFRNRSISDDEAARQAAFDQYMPKQEHMERLFGTDDGRKLWGLLEPALGEMRKNTARLKAELESGGAVKEVKVIDTRADDSSKLYMETLRIIPKDIGVYRAVIVSESGVGSSSAFLVIDGKMVFVQGLDSMYSHLKSGQ